MRLTARSPKNNMAYLVNVKPNEQEVESSYPNTLKCIMDSFERLAKYEETGLEPDTIEALQQENEQLRERLQKSPYGDDKIDELEQAIEFIRFENEQLKARDAAMGEASQKAVEILQDMVDVANVSGSAYLYKRDTGKVIEVLTAIDKAIGGGEK